MSDRRLAQVRARLVGLLRTDPPARVTAAALDSWVVARLSREEVEVLLRADREYGEDAMSEWLVEVLVEAGVVPCPLPLAG
jgi:hypothetical protein